VQSSKRTYLSASFRAAQESQNKTSEYLKMPPIAYSIASKDITTSIDLLINHLITDKDETGEFLLHLEDGRIIDTKGWAGWEWTHGIGLYGLWK